MSLMHCASRPLALAASESHSLVSFWEGGVFSLLMGESLSPGKTQTCFLYMKVHQVFVMSVGVRRRFQITWNWSHMTTEPWRSARGGRVSLVQPQTFKSRFVLFASLSKLLFLTANIFLASHNTEPSRCILSAPADLLLTMFTLLHDPEADLEGLLVFWGLASGSLSRILELRKRGKWSQWFS